ncbi:hypothetical protein V0R37_02980 [Pollutimonas sp. H1-120]|uniref:hypothetical protein n=1 Tax=Pollutimonas sp. H1-120 TaxID=3148824 RepID=UPI003B52728F
MNDAASMTENSIKARVNVKLAEYENRPLLEQYAIFMGRAQILEFGLKGLLMHRFNAPTDSVEHLTLGKRRMHSEIEACDLISSGSWRVWLSIGTIWRMNSW